MALVQPWIPEVGQSIQNPETGATYVIGQQLGEGGFGSVHLCSDARGQVFVAKFAKPEGIVEDVAQRWAAECRLMLSVNSHHIIRLIDFFRYRNVFWMVMERADCTLRERITTRGKLNVRDSVLAGFHLLLALQELNARNIVHRDLHIDNILWSSAPGFNALKIADFGVAKQLAITGAVATTRIGRAYDVAPELLHSGYTTHQSDLYQVGLAMYFVHTGVEALNPLDGAPREAILSGVARGRAEQLKTPLGDYIAVLLRRTVEYRFLNAQQAMSELAKVAQHYGVSI